MEKLREIPWWGWLLAVAIAGLGFLVWHSYATNPDDDDWGSPQSADEVPGMVALPLAKLPFGPAHGTGSPMSTATAPFQVRMYPDCLASSKTCIIGGVPDDGDS